jgi:methylphosphotriester-DNA--protein-cysteine methyltransferase
MGGKGFRFLVICIAAICVALLAMRFSRMRESSLQDEIAAQQAGPAEMFYVGSKIDKIYHNPSCRLAVKLNTDELVTFTSARQATSKGYSPCETCRP